MSNLTPPLVGSKREKAKKALALVCALASPKPAATQTTGNEFLGLCDLVLQGGRKVGKNHCTMFVLGWRTAFRFATNRMINAKVLSSDQDDLNLNPIMGICFHKGLTNAQLTDGFIKFLQDYPKHRHITYRPFDRKRYDQSLPLPLTPSLVG